jgi:3-hydroxyisobutyrate dehydrogenase-like beta-hydroxyacid dehydrogenase
VNVESFARFSPEVEGRSLERFQAGTPNPCSGGKIGPVGTGAGPACRSRPGSAPPRVTARRALKGARPERKATWVRIAVLHPGEMGSAVATALPATVTVGWCAQDRSDATRHRAEGASLEEFASLGDVATWAEAIVSVCPPAAARDLAQDVVAAGFRGLYLDANAVSPATAVRIGAEVEAAGATFVDGGIVGPAPRQEGTTRLFLAGGRAPEVAAWFEDGPLDTVVLPGVAGDASALKAAYAGWTKASTALLVAVRAYARAAGVEDALLEEWDRSQPGLRDRSDGSFARLSRTAWRFEGEMREIASTMDDHGLPADFHDGAAAVFQRLARQTDTEDDPDRVLDRFLDP